MRTWGRNGKALEDLDDDVQLVHKLEDELRGKKRPHGSCASTENPLKQGKLTTAKTAGPGEQSDARDNEDRGLRANIAQDPSLRAAQNPSLRAAQDPSLRAGIAESNSAEPPEKTPPGETQWNKETEFYKNTPSKSFRQYDLACDRVKDFYQEQHEHQTVAYNIQARINFKSKVRARMSVWEGLEKLNKLLDESDPDTELSQIDHALQTAEAIRRDHKPRWMQLVGLIHDLGKLLYFFDSRGQWDVVGDTFPVGCRFLKKIIFSDSFRRNPDFSNPLYNTKFGIYSKKCGLDSVMLSWGHDEYMYHIAKTNSTLPPEALAMIRYHSFYPWHHENAYKYLMNDEDVQLLEAVRSFNKYDLYSKADDCYNVEDIKPYYKELIDEFFSERVIEF
ncbi:DUF706-domain-containing protein [Metschnikowia bicuspidata var. bicuspidata NRRL YB-4993]|uniref:Inositol oxygenase n=1 Tax=Metschnikowia bicuspidata var. bicuspidata NRRL YB-4993 TaxID=869754 RepID=A0A1A0HBU2_9ASCO|nr:DUF706-domain-containing protein [Metschnikowia bicuspidata var. bicuspidata NRRL YB-4993]OBA21358.1 DUF706-domain-containing protein [Metschnikowia bicuspidata var. bicuspidata NRRL YB-4993]